MKNYQYILEPYKGRKTRYSCPACHKPNEFTRYINKDTGAYVAEYVGRCNRTDNCGYTLTPFEYARQEGITLNSSPVFSINSTPLVLPTAPIAYEVYTEEFVQSTRTNFENNALLQYLTLRLSPDAVALLIKRYGVGTTRDGSTIFWMFDEAGHARTGQIIPYDAATGKRIKNVIPPVTWVHRKRNIGPVQQCLFGEHLLTQERQKPVAIVESPKTALIATLYFPQYVWVATCGKHGGVWSNPTLAMVLQGRNVFLFPDLGFDKSANVTTLEVWERKAEKLRQAGIKVQTVDLLEQVATPAEKKDGLDLADFLLRFSYQEFQNGNLPAVIQQKIAGLSDEMQQRVHLLAERFGLVFYDRN
jgi:hypothetical protein